MKSAAATAADNARWEHIWQTRHHQPWLRQQAHRPYVSIGTSAAACAAAGEPDDTFEGYILDIPYEHTNPRRSKYA